MAYYRKTDFAKMVGTTTGNLANLAKRGKVVYSGKYVDDSLEVNKEFIKSRKELLKKRGKKLVKVEAIPLNKIKKADLKDSSPVSTTKQAELKMLKDVEDLRKKRIAADRAELEYQQMIGSSIPTELVVQVIALLGQSFMTTFNNGASALLDEFSHRKKLKAKEKAELKGKLVEIINDSMSNGVTQAQLNIDNIVKAHQDGIKK